MNKRGRPKAHEIRKMPPPEAPFKDKVAAMGGKRGAFLAAYSQCYSIQKASEISGCANKDHFYWMKTDADYPEMFRQAAAEAFEFLESRARERAMEGSDSLMIFLLKAGRPEVYRDTHQLYVDGKVKHIGEIDINHKEVVELTVDELPLAMRRQMLELIRRKQEAASQPDIGTNGHSELLCLPCQPDTPKPA